MNSFSSPLFRKIYVICFFVTIAFSNGGVYAIDNASQSSPSKNVKTDGNLRGKRRTSTEPKPPTPNNYTRLPPKIGDSHGESQQTSAESNKIFSDPPMGPFPIDNTKLPLNSKLKIISAVLKDTPTDIPSDRKKRTRKPEVKSSTADDVAKDLGSGGAPEKSLDPGKNSKLPVVIADKIAKGTRTRPDRLGKTIDSNIQNDNIFTSKNKGK